MRVPRSAVVALVSALALPACTHEEPPPATPVYQPQPGPMGGPVGTPPANAVLYKLPVVGQWRVLRTHYASKSDQAFAVDLIVDQPGPHGQVTNQSFPSYNQPIVADAPGVVNTVVDGLPENNPPNAANGYDFHGNFVVIDHRNGEYSLFAHMIPGSIKVRPGQEVAYGTELGRCGNSGHSTLPHLHWQVMDNPIPGYAHAVAPRMAPYRKNGGTSQDILQDKDVLSNL